MLNFAYTNNNILFIGGNFICDEGAKAIGTALITNSALTNLDIGMSYT